jgi:hypothetical protein
MVYLQKSDGSQGLSIAAGADGKFVFENVARGNYRVTAERRGFLRGEYGSRRYGQRGGLIALTDGQQMKGADVKLDPQSVIAGRILDEHGEPMEQVQVMALRRVVAADRRQAGPAGMAQTDDRGEFRIANLAPGRYYVQAMSSRREMMQGRNIRRVDVAEPETYVVTYFPGTTEASAATPVELGVGQEFLGLSLQVQKARVYKVRGTVQGVEARNLRVMANPRGRIGFGGGPGASSGVRPDGGFELTGLAPGSYTIFAARGGPGGGGTVRAAVEVSNADLDGVSLVFGATFSVQGTVKIEGSTTFSPGNLRLQLVEAEGGTMAPMGQTKEDGTFTIDNVSADRYRLWTAFLPRGLYLKSVRMSGQDVTRQVIDLTSGAPGRFEVLLGNKPSSISGTVGKAAPESLPGLVILVPDGGLPMQMGVGPIPPGNQYEASVDQNGAFAIENVPPGEYRVYAFEEFDRAEGYDPDFLKKFESSSEKLKLGEGDVKTLALKQIPSDGALP